MVLNVWTFVSITHDGSTAKIYINGESVATSPGCPTQNVVRPDNFIGIFNNHYHTHAAYSDMKIYNRSLSSEEILQSHCPIEEMSDEN